MAACKCSERNAVHPSDIKPGSNYRPRQWFITLLWETSLGKISDFSTVHCRVCGAYWKTKAEYVNGLPRCEYFPAKVPPVQQPILETRS